MRDMKQSDIRPSRVLKAIGFSNGPEPIRAPRKDLELPEKIWMGKEDFSGMQTRYVVYIQLERVP